MRLQQQNHHPTVTCHPCPMCKESFAHLSQLVKHIEVHNNNRPTLSSEPSLPSKKIRLVGGATLQITPAAMQPPQTTATALTSILTPTASPLSTTLPKASTKVVIAKTNSRSSRFPSVRSKLTCEICEETFNELPFYRGHLQNVHQLYLICPDCHQVAGDVGEMTRHMKNVHPHLNVPPCTVCGRCFIDLESARNHLEAHKNGLADFSGCFQCSHCEALYDSEHDCTLHEATHPSDFRALLS